MKSALALLQLNIPAFTNYSQTLAKKPTFVEAFVESVEQSADPICIMDYKGMIEYANKAFERVTGYTQKELIGSTLSKLSSQREGKKHSKNIWKALSSGNPYRSEVINHSKQGQMFYVDQTITPIKDYRGSVCCMMCIWKDITQNKKVEKKIRYQAMRDPLTKLPNRRLVNDRLDVAISNSHRSNKQMAILYLDIDKFKPVNDTYGHRAGDKVLKEVAHRLQQSVRSCDTVGRVGGDEFIIIMEDIKNIDHANAIAQVIQESIREPIKFDGHEILIDSSVGLAVYPLHGTNTSTIINKADYEMRRLKAERRSPRN